MKPAETGKMTAKVCRYRNTRFVVLPVVPSTPTVPVDSQDVTSYQCSVQRLYIDYSKPLSSYTLSSSADRKTVIPAIAADAGGRYRQRNGEEQRHPRSIHRAADARRTHAPRLARKPRVTVYITATVAVATGAPRDPLRHRVTSPIPVTSRGRPGARRACQSAGAMNTARRPPTHQSVPATRVQDAAAARRPGLCGRPFVFPAAAVPCYSRAPGRRCSQHISLCSSEAAPASSDGPFAKQRNDSIRFDARNDSISFDQAIEQLNCNQG